MSQGHTEDCPRCGSPVADNTTLGLCPGCLMRNLLNEPQSAAENGALDENVLEPTRRLEPEDVLLVNDDTAQGGQRFGEYRILGEIARGGMGVIYRAEQVRAGRIVALKVVAFATRLNKRAEERFRAEAELVATLDHPHIVPVYEVGEVDGRAFFTMKLVSGADLATEVAKGRWGLNEWLDPDQVRPPSTEIRAPETWVSVRKPGARIAWLMATVARAVQHAHERGILHRDLKPSNILIEEGGRPYVTDFGLAKRMDVDASLTQSGSLLGTPSYMAPEQVQGDGRFLTTATDVYSLGAILFHLLTGRPPFEGESSVQVIQSVIGQEPVSPRTRNFQVDPDLATICLKCLQKNPKQRYRSARLLAEDLESWLRNETITARPPSSFERARKWIARSPAKAMAIGLAFAAVVAIIVLQWVWGQRVQAFAEKAQESAREQRVLREAAERAKEELAEHVVRLEAQAAEEAFDRGDSAEGISRLARLVRQDPKNYPLVRRLIGAISSRRFAQPVAELPVPGQPDLLECSEDGRWLAVVMDDLVQVWDCDRRELAGPPLRHDSQVRVCRFSHDGRRLAIGSRKHEIRVWSVLDGQLKAGPYPHDIKVDPMIFAPDDSTLLVAEDRLTMSKKPSLHFYPLNSDGSTVSRVPHDSTIHAVETDPTGRYIVTATFWGFLRILDAATGEPVVDPEEIPMVVTQMAFEPDGERFVAVGGRREAVMWNLTSGEVLHRLRHPEQIDVIDWSPDGEMIASAGRESKIYLWRRETGFRLAREIPTGASVEKLAFLKSSRLLGTVLSDGSAKVWDVETRQPVVEGVRWEEAIAFSPDSARVAAMQGRSVLLWDLNRPQAEPKERLEHDNPKVKDILFSEDGRIAYTVTASASVHPWDLATGEAAYDPENPTTQIRSMDISADGQSAVIASGLGPDAWIIGAERKPRVAATGPPSTPLTFVAFVEGDKRILTVNENGLARLWSPTRGELISECRLVDFQVEHCDLDATEQSLLLCGPAGRAVIRQWTEPSGPATVLETGWREAVTGGRFSPNGRYLLLMSELGRIAFYDRESSALIKKSFVSGLRVVAARFSPDGARALIVTSGGDVLIIRLDQASTVSPTRLAGSKLVDARFSPDGRQVVTAGKDWAARLWDAQSGLPVAEPVRHTSPLYSAAMTPDGSQLITGSFDRGYLRNLSKLRIEGQAPAWLPEFAEALVGERSLGQNHQETIPEQESRNVLERIQMLSGDDSYSSWARAILNNRE